MNLEDLTRRVAEAFRLLQGEIDDTNFRSRKDFKTDRVLLMLFSKSIRLGLAVCHLVSGGFYGEAFGLMRSVLEACFIAKYVSTTGSEETGGSEERADSYLNFALAHFYNREEIRRKYFPEEEPPEWLTQEMLDVAKRRYPNTRHWVPAYNMATEYYDHPLEVDPKTGKGFQATSDYEGTYETTSHYVHTTIVSMIPHLAEPEECFRTAKIDTEVSKALLALQYSLAYVLMTGITVGRHWGVELRPEMVSETNSLLDELRTAATEDSGIVWRTRKPKS
jgi:hypothetical protein